jgi:hypothetical protein
VDPGAPPYSQGTTVVVPDELAEAFGPIYREGLENMKAQLEG